MIRKMNMKTKRYVAGIMIFGCLGLAAVSVPAFAGSSNTSFQINTTIAGSCTVSAGDVVLGAYDSGAGLTGSGTISYQCTPGTSPSIGLNAGQWAAGDISRRNLFDGAHSLAYQIYSDPGYSVVWGTGSNGASPLSASGDGNNDTATMYVQVFSGQTQLNAGTYTDTVTAEIDW